MSGILITFEGIEGCGKTTQIEKAEVFLKEKGFSVIRTYEPGSTLIGKHIRKILLHNDKVRSMHPLCELLLFEAERAQHVAEVIIPALNQGCIVLCDRYIDSTTAYQGGGRGIDIKIITHLHEIASLGVFPVRTYLFDVPVEIGLQRIHHRSRTLDRFESETIEFHSRIRDYFLQLAKNEPNRILLIDGTLTEQQIMKIIQHDLLELLARR